MVQLRKIELDHWPRSRSSTLRRGAGLPCAPLDESGPYTLRMPARYVSSARASQGSSFALVQSVGAPDLSDDSNLPRLCCLFSLRSTPTVGIWAAIRIGPTSVG